MQSRPYTPLVHLKCSATPPLAEFPACTGAGEVSMRKVLVGVLATSCALAGCAVRPDYLRDRTAEQTPCSPGQVVILSSTKNDFAGNFSWEAKCRMHTYRCNQRIPPGHRPYARPVITCEETAESREMAMARASRARRARQPRQPQRQPQPAKASRISQEEGHRILKAAEPEMARCIKGAPAPVRVEIQINGDGSTIYLGSQPTIAVEQSSCLRQLFNTIRFRATGADPFPAKLTVHPEPSGQSEPPETTAEDPEAGE